MDVSAGERLGMLDPAARHGVSPHDLRATTLGAWVKAPYPRSKSLALGTDNRIPIAYAGKRFDAVYWYDSASGRFTSSTFYSAVFKPWVTAFNTDELPNYQPHV